MTLSFPLCVGLVLGVSMSSCRSASHLDAASANLVEPDGGGERALDSSTADRATSEAPAPDATRSPDVAVEVVAPGPYPDKANLLVYREADGTLRPITDGSGWEKRRAHVLANMQLVMGPLPGESKRAPLAPETQEEVTFPSGVVRRLITYQAEPGDRVSAYLVLPPKRAAKRPGMLALHFTSEGGKNATAGVGSDPSYTAPYGLELAERGYVTIVPDYFGYPGFHFDQARLDKLGYQSGTMKGIWNHVRAIDLLQSLPEVDPERIGAVGFSLGGHNALFVSAFDRRIKAVASSSGFDSFYTYQGGDLSNWCQVGLMPRVCSLYDHDPKRMPFDFTEIVGTLAPRPFWVNAPVGDTNFDHRGVEMCITAAKPVYDLYRSAAKVTVRYPPGPHGFEQDARQLAYEFFDKALGNVPQ